MNLRRWKKRAHPKFRAQVERAEALGWRFEFVTSGHVAAFDQNGKRRWSAPATPSDHRSQLNAASQLRRAIDDPTGGRIQ